MAVGDFRGDGTPEVAATSAKSKPEDGGIAFVLALESGRVQRTRLGRRPSARKHRAWPRRSSTRMQCWRSAQFGGVEVVCFDGRTFGGQWAALHFDGITAVGVGTSEGETQADLFLATFGPAVVAVSGSDGSPRWSSPIFDVSGFIINQIDLADVSGDARPEIVAGSMNMGVAGLTATLVPTPGRSWRGPGICRWFRPSAFRAPVRLHCSWLDWRTATLFPPTRSRGCSDRLSPPFRPQRTPWGSPTSIVMALPTSWQPSATTFGYWTARPGYRSGSPYLRLSEFFSVPRLPLLAGDLDRDTVPEILVATLDGIVHFEAPLLLIFANGFESGDTSNW